MAPGAPRARCRFTLQVDKRTGADPRARDLGGCDGNAAEGVEQAHLRLELTCPTGLRPARRSSVRWPRPSRRSTTSSARAGWAPCTTSFPAAGGPGIILPWGRGMERATRT